MPKKDYVAILIPRYAIYENGDVEYRSLNNFSPVSIITLRAAEYEQLGEPKNINIIVRKIGTNT